MSIATRGLSQSSQSQIWPTERSPLFNRVFETFFFFFKVRNIHLKPLAPLEKVEDLVTIASAFAPLNGAWPSRFPVPYWLSYTETG